MDRLYCSLDERYKSPRGALPAGGSVRFALTIPGSYGFVEPRLELAKDGCPFAEYRMEYTGTEAGVCRFSLTLALDEVGLYFYYFDLYSDYRKLYRGVLGEAVLTRETGACWQLTVYEADFSTPKELAGATMYQIFPDRFFEGRPHGEMPFADRVYRANKKGEPYFWPNERGGQLNLDYFGGDFAGITQKLPYLESLGVGWVYLNPIFEAHANHRYNTADYLNADPLLGTNEEFEQLCAEAKKRGIRIILDGVFSHTGSDSRYFNREGRYGRGGAYHDPASPYRPWYIFSDRYPCGYRSWWGFDTLPEVNESDPGYRRFICGEGGVIDTWLKRGASGFRLDVADELPDDFIAAIRTAVKAHGPDKYLLGEVWEDATTKVAYGVRRSYLLGKGLDGVMNYPFRTAILDFLRGGNPLAAAEQFAAICERYPAPALNALMNHLGTHDTERLITALVGEPAGGRDRYWQSGRRVSRALYDRGVQLARMAYAILFTLPGVPCVYYGDEVGMQGYRDPFNRAYYDWDSAENRIKPLIASLAKLRRECDAFWDGRFDVVAAGGGLLQYRRTGRTETAEIAVNRTGRLMTVRALGKTVEVEPNSFTIVVDDNKNAQD